MTKKPIIALLTVVLFVVAWQMAIRAADIPEYLLPSPSVVGSYVINNLQVLIFHLGVTFFEAFAGLLVALIWAFATAATLTVVRSAKDLALPIIIGMQAIPVVAVAPVLSLWFGVGLVSKIAMAALLCWFPMVVNAIRGFETTTLEQKSLFMIYGATRTQLFFNLQLPQSVRFLLSGARTSAGLAMIGAIVAEYTGASAGLGYIITQSTYRLDTPELFAAILLAALAGLALSWALGFIEKTFLQRYLRV